MREKLTKVRKDWRVGITLDVFFLGFYSLSSIFEILADPTSTNLVAVLLLGGLGYYTYSAYKIQRGDSDTKQGKSAIMLGFVMLAAFLFFTVANFTLMISSELPQDMSYLNLLLLFALFKSVSSLRKLDRDGKSKENG